ncbi:unnamed protein product [Ceutorhynchus assimilis]|uniref:Uncharacterized protein n=1 Tax=Ceutorhynchus assimilis TaxID=467358 RepID=A0A9N9MKM0_9CUCU|nr:unnamed protein product [Ceutorhynchus assimilis]
MGKPKAKILKNLVAPEINSIEQVIMAKNASVKIIKYHSNNKKKSSLHEDFLAPSTNFKENVIINDLINVLDQVESKNVDVESDDERYEYISPPNSARLGSHEDFLAPNTNYEENVIINDLMNVLDQVESKNVDVESDDERYEYISPPNSAGLESHEDFLAPSTNYEENVIINDLINVLDQVESKNVDVESDDERYEYISPPNSARLGSHEDFLAPNTNYEENVIINDLINVLDQVESKNVDVESDDERYEYISPPNSAGLESHEDFLAPSTNYEENVIINDLISVLDEVESKNAVQQEVHMDIAENNMDSEVETEMCDVIERDLALNDIRQKAEIINIKLNTYLDK